MVRLIRSATGTLRHLRRTNVHVLTYFVLPTLATDAKEAIERPHRGVSLEMVMARLRAHDAVAQRVADYW